jgi:AraC-like DNA-binding protein
VVIGPQTRAGYFAGKDVPTCVRLRLRPARSRPLLGAAPAELVNRGAPLTDFWGPAATALARSLAGLDGDPVRILAALADALLDRLPGGSALVRSDLTAGAARVVAGGGPLTLVARRVGVSERHLRNLFAAEMGVSPKHYARIARLRRVLAGAGEHGWAELARATGYYDQAHLSADFGAMMGVPPGAFLDGRLPAPSRCD